MISGLYGIALFSWLMNDIGDGSLHLEIIINVSLILKVLHFIGAGLAQAV
jgi:hypothetical protein